MISKVNVMQLLHAVSGACEPSSSTTALLSKISVQELTAFPVTRTSECLGFESQQTEFGR